jgi:undecaprenyl-phosphate 4-deoxy-4-formamido-L-arabinose transferase
MNQMQTPQVSIVVPVYNEESNVAELVRRLTAAMAPTGRTFEILAVNDGSRDRSLELLRKEQEQHPELVVVDLNRNFGQHAAIFAGFEASRGRVVVTIDADLQNPPEEIPKLLEAWDRGHDVVGTIRKGRQDSIFRKTLSFCVNRSTNRITGLRITDYGCMLRAYDRVVVDAMRQGREISTFIPALAASFARNMTEVEVSHSARQRGESKYSLLKLINLQFDLVTSFSLWPLRLLFVLGVFAALSGVGLGVYILIKRVTMDNPDEWTNAGTFTLFAILFIFVGAMFLGLGLIGEYLGRVYMEVRRRPNFIVREIVRKDGGTPPENGKTP